MTLLSRVLSLVLPVSVLALAPPLAPSLVLQDNAQLPLVDDVKVPVILGVMSRCPDALICENVFDQVLTKIMNKIDLTLTYVAQIDSSEPDFGVKCLHGPEECAGNVQQLCVAKYTDPNAWWSFVHCQNFQGAGKIGTPEVALKCAKTANIDWENGGAGQCAGLDGSGKGEEGVGLLQQSVQDTEALGIEKSCTILINGRQVCIHDGEWKQCEAGHTPNDFIRQINSEYERINSHGHEN